MSLPTSLRRALPFLVPDLAFAVVVNLYATQFRPVLQDWTAAAFFSGVRNPALGWVLLGTLIAETVALLLVLPAIGDSAARRGARGSVLLERFDSLLWIFHMVVGCLLALVVIKAWKIDPDRQPLAFLLLVSFPVIKDLLLMLYSGIALDRPAKKGTPGRLRTGCGWILLAAATVVMTTVSWELWGHMFGSSIREMAGTGDPLVWIALVLFFAALGILFVVLYLPARLGFLLRSLRLVDSRRDEVFLLVSLAIAAGGAFTAIL
jgi:hypothetical protein